MHLLETLNQTKYADVELNSDHAEQCIYTNDFIESQINGDDFDEWYSDVYPFCTGKLSEVRIPNRPKKDAFARHDEPERWAPFSGRIRRPK